MSKFAEDFSPASVPLMRSVHLLWFVFIPFFSFSISSIASGQIEFSKDGIQKIKGESICEFTGEFYKRLGVFTDSSKKYSVEYREREGITALFLLVDSHPPDYCGQVINSQIVPITHRGDTVLFKCRIKGQPDPGWGNIVGLGDNHLGRLRFVTVSTAWQVDIERGSFQKVEGKIVICDASGYTHAK